MEISGTVLLLLVVLVVVVLFLVGGCSLSCSQRSAFTKGTQENSEKEGYARSCLAGDCFGLQRTPVDYAQKFPNGWQRNPHYKANPADEHQPLDYGPVDFYPDSRRMNANNGVLFQQYRNDWHGCGKDLVYLTNDEKNRFDLTNVGDQGARNQLDDLYSPRFGAKGYEHNERSYDEPNPYYGKIYGGAAYLVHDKLGD